MDLIDFEIRKEDFIDLVRAILKASPAVPFPLLALLGPDRLIQEIEWLDGIAIVPTINGHPPADSGTFNLSAPVRIRHVSIAELKLDPNAAGMTKNSIAWINVNASADSIGLDAFSIGGVHVPSPQRVATLPLPTLAGIGGEGAVLILEKWSVLLRLSTSADANNFDYHSPRPETPFGPEGAPGGGNWRLHVPGGFFADLIRSRLQTRLSPPPDGMTVEEGLWAQWTNVSPTMLGKPLIPDLWGVRATVGLEKEDACPTLFGDDVDMSVDVTANAAFVVSEADERLNIGLTVSTDASDWDSFRCWVGSGAPFGLALDFAQPFFGAEVTLGLLIGISESVRKQVGGAIGGPIDQFTEVSRTTSSVTYAASIPIDVMPFSTLSSATVDETGLTVIGTILSLAPDRQTSFVPAKGPLAGSWDYKINCSHRSFESNFAPQDVMIIDDRTFAGAVVRSLPVRLYYTSMSEPAGKCWIETPSPVARIQVPIHASGLAPGEAGFVMIHSSAGLRAYTIGPVPARPTLPIGAEKMMNQFCDTFLVPSKKIDIQQVKWIEPEPDYEYGQEALRQWQIVIERVADLGGIEVLADDAGAQRPIASGADFAGNATRAAIEITTNARTELGLRIPKTEADARFAVRRRWLLPLHRVELREPVTALRRVRGDIEIHSANRMARFDLNSWTLGAFEPAKGGGLKRAGSIRSLSLPDGKVAALHEGALIIALPLNTLSGAAADETPDTGERLSDRPA